MVDVFEEGSGKWYAGTIQRIQEEEGEAYLNMAFPHFESEVNKYSKSE